MSTQVQRRKGTTVQHATFTGASAELTVDTTKNTVVVHDGATAGGIPLAKETGSAISATAFTGPLNGSVGATTPSTGAFTTVTTTSKINGISVGKGGVDANGSALNTAIGNDALRIISSTRSGNVAVGASALYSSTNGRDNVAVGFGALFVNPLNSYNVAVGASALFSAEGSYNTAVGRAAGSEMSTGSKNTIIGNFNGFQAGLDIRTADNYIVLSDGDGNPRAYWNGANPTFPGALTLSDGTANGVAYLNGSKVLTSGTALTFDGTNLNLGASVSKIGNSTSAGGVFNVVSDFDPTSALNLKGASNIAFYTYSGSFSEQMRLTSTGLGIGTSSPGAKLDVNGSVQIVNDLTFNRPGVGSTISSADLLSINAAAGKSLTFNSSAVVLDASGNLGLGVTPQARLNVQYADSAPTSSGTMSSGVVLQYATGGIALNMGTSSGGYSYFNSAYANNAGVAAAYRFYQGATQAMTLDSSGNLGIGDTAPSSNGKVSIIVPSLAGYSPNVAAWNASNGTGAMRLWIANLAYAGVGANEPWLHSYQNINIGSDANIAIKFISGGEKARIDASGNLLVGTTSQLTGHLFSASTNAGASVWGFGPYVGAANNFYVSYNGNTGVYLVGGATAWTANSDERLKTNFVSFENAASKVCTLRAGTGRYLTDKESVSRSFLIAQDVQKVLPEAVSVKDDETGTLGVAYTDVIPLLVAAIKEQQAMIEDLKTRLAALEAK